MEVHLSINGGPLTSAESLGVMVTQRNLVNRGVDTVSISVARRAGAAPLWGTDAKVAITLNGALWFTGWSTKFLRDNGASKYGQHCTLRGPWHWMASAPYRISNGTAGPVGYTGGNPLPSFPTSAVAWDVLKVYADPALAPYCTIPRWPDSLTQVQYVGYPYINGAVSEMFLTLLTYNMLSGTRFDYTQPVPALQVVNRQDCVKTLSVGVGGVQSAPMQFRDDLWPKGVEIRVNDDSPGASSAPQMTNPLDFAGQTDCYPQNMTRGAPGTVTVYSFWQDTNVNMAEMVFRFMCVPIWEGTINVANAITGVRPGDTLSLSNLTADYDPDCRTMGAVVQTVTENLLAGTTTITTGAQGHGEASTAIEFLQDLLRLAPWKSTNEFGWWFFKQVGT